MKFIINIDQSVTKECQQQAVHYFLKFHAALEQNKEAQGTENISTFPRYSTYRVSVPKLCFGKLTVKGKTNCNNLRKNGHT